MRLRPSAVIVGNTFGSSAKRLASAGMGASFAFFFATGGGTFHKGGTFSAGTTQTAKNAVIGRFTNSGYGDVAITTATGIVMLLGNGAAFTMGPSTSYPYPLSAFSNGQFEESADFDKDGKLDLAVNGPGFILIFWGGGNGSFTSASALSQSSFPRSMAV